LAEQRRKDREAAVAEKKRERKEIKCILRRLREEQERQRGLDLMYHQRGHHQRINTLAPEDETYGALSSSLPLVSRHHGYRDITALSDEHKQSRSRGRSTFHSEKKYRYRHLTYAEIAARISQKIVTETTALLQAYNAKHINELPPPVQAKLITRLQQLQAQQVTHRHQKYHLIDAEINARRGLSGRFAAGAEVRNERERLHLLKQRKQRHEAREKTKREQLKRKVDQSLGVVPIHTTNNQILSQHYIQSLHNIPTFNNHITASDHSPKTPAPNDNTPRDKTYQTSA